MALPFFVTVEQASINDDNRLWVRTFNTSGVQADPSSGQGFSLHVVC